jgi:hypothetical protein
MTKREWKIHVKFYLENIHEGVHCRYGRRKKLGMDLKKQGVGNWIGFSWLSLRSNGYKADADGVVK